MAWLLDYAYLLVLSLLSPWLLYRAIRTGRYRRGLCEKLFGLRQAPTPGAIWFHGVSVGEIHLLRQVVAAFRRRFPALPCVISTTTETGYDEARRCFPDLFVFYYPFDFSWAVRNSIHAVSPRLIVLAEAELWPNFLTEARRQAVPVAVINGRMSPRSFKRYQSMRALAQGLFGKVDRLAMQTEQYAHSIRMLGASPDRVAVTGNIKFDGVMMDRCNSRTQSLRELLSVSEEDLIWVAGSTQAPEEEIVVRIWRKLRVDYPRLRLLLVPRHKERFEEVARILARENVEFSRRSRGTGLDRSLILVDTIGELGPLWGLADVAFVGGSLDGRRGGQNMIEPAAYGSAVVFGPYVWNFAETATRLIDAHAACQVSDAGQLETVVRSLLGDNEERRTLGTAAREFVRRQQGATAQTIELLGQLLSSRRSIAA